MAALATVAVGVLSAATPSGDSQAQEGEQQQDEQAGAAGERDLFDRVVERARKLAQESYSPPPGGVPEPLRELDYRQYQDIRFKKERALWGDNHLFSAEFFHLGFLFQHPVVVNEVVDGNVRTIQYQPDMFDLGVHQELGAELSRDLGFAGFRLHFPIDSPGYQDEVISFLGASYFRMVGRDQGYGLSGRGLAVNTALPRGEEFPRFTEFWLVRPEPEAATATFYALLDSESVTGAYRFDFTPGASSVLDVKSRLFARRNVQKLGVAPLTSMFMWGENRVRHFDDHRPEVHDSDGLLVHSGNGEWIWRPLTNPVEARVSSLLDKNPKGFGLVQRDRSFGSYLDLERNYHSRPSFWVSPDDGWGKGAVQLIEIPSGHESNDNIVAFWVPDEPLEAGGERSFDYSVQTFWSHRRAETLATVQRTRIGRSTGAGEGEPPRGRRRFTVDFAGGPLARMRGRQPLEPRLSIAKGQAENVTVKRLPDSEGWRVAFNLRPDAQAQPVDMRLHLALRGRRLTETWNYVWDPKLIR